MKRLLLSLVLLAGCAQQPPPPALPAVQAAADDDWYRQALRRGVDVQTIDPAASLIAVTVRRAGAFSRFGHDHVVASRGVTGFAAPGEGRADFQFKFDEMTVDEGLLRQQAGFDTQPDADAIAGTRRNMLTRVLDAEHFPLVVLHAQRRDGNLLALSITLHGVTRTIDVPTTIEAQGDGMVASGALQIAQTDFGITPLSLLGGAISVQDALEIRFRLVTHKAH